MAKYGFDFTVVPQFVDGVKQTIQTKLVYENSAMFLFGKTTILKWFSLTPL